MYRTRIFEENFSKQDENGYQFCLDEELTKYCKEEQPSPSDSKTILPPIHYSVFQVWQWAKFRCWILMDDETRVIMREEHNDFQMKLIIEALKMSELGKTVGINKRRNERKS